MHYEQTEETKQQTTHRGCNKNDTQLSYSRRNHSPRRLTYDKDDQGYGYKGYQQEGKGKRRMMQNDETYDIPNYDHFRKNSSDDIYHTSSDFVSKPTNITNVVNITNIANYHCDPTHKPTQCTNRYHPCDGANSNRTLSIVGRNFEEEEKATQYTNRYHPCDGANSNRTLSIVGRNFGEEEKASNNNSQKDRLHDGDNSWHQLLSTYLKTEDDDVYSSKPCTSEQSLTRFDKEGPPYKRHTGNSDLRMGPQSTHKSQTHESIPPSRTDSQGDSPTSLTEWYYSPSSTKSKPDTSVNIIGHPYKEVPTDIHPYKQEPTYAVNEHNIPEVDNSQGIEPLNTNKSYSNNLVQSYYGIDIDTIQNNINSDKSDKSDTSQHSLMNIDNVERKSAIEEHIKKIYGESLREKKINICAVGGDMNLKEEDKTWQEKQEDLELEIEDVDKEKERQKSLIEQHLRHLKYKNILAFKREKSENDTKKNIKLNGANSEEGKKKEEKRPREQKQVVVKMLECYSDTVVQMLQCYRSDLT